MKRTPKLIVTENTAPAPRRYTVTEMHNTTKFYIGEQLPENIIDSEIRSGVHVVIKGKTK